MKKKRNEVPWPWGLSRLCTKSHDGALLCATSVVSVALWLMNSEQKHTTETQSTQRLHRGTCLQSEPGLLARPGGNELGMKDIIS